MTIGIRGIGWLTPEGFGCIRSGLQHVYEQGESAHTLQKKNVFSHPFKNFGRLDAVSRMTAYAVSLALQDAGIEYSPVQKQEIGIVGTNAEGSLKADIDYFRDYVESGRTLSRGNLFIYTLPSSAIGESAIHFGFLGPALYAAGGENQLRTALDMAREMLDTNQAQVMLAGKAEPGEAVFFVLDADRSRGIEFLCDLEEALALSDTSPHIAVLVEKFLLLAGRKV